VLDRTSVCLLIQQKKYICKYYDSDNNNNNNNNYYYYYITGSVYDALLFLTALITQRRYNRILYLASGIRAILKFE